jgi:hypothetical protein
MTNSFGRQKFLQSEEGLWLRDELMKMVKSPKYNTKPLYSTGASGKFQFVERKLEYMSKFPTMNHRQYVANLKLMTLVKGGKA